MNRGPRPRRLSVDELNAFLVEAKPRAMTDPSPYGRDGLRYEVERFGQDPELGVEVVWYGDVPAWGMAVHGGLLREFAELREAVAAVFRQALARPEPERPVRGPSRLVDGDFVYVNSVSGDVRSFAGRDAVYWRERLVGFYDYVGGALGGAVSLVAID
jgi:hypothetical protein